MIDDPIKYVRDRSTEDADCWLWRHARCDWPEDDSRESRLWRFNLVCLTLPQAGRSASPQMEWFDGTATYEPQ